MYMIPLNSSICFSFHSLYLRYFSPVVLLSSFVLVLAPAGEYDEVTTANA